MKPVLLKFSYDVQTIKKNKYVLSKSMELKKAKWNVFENGSIREEPGIIMPILHERGMKGLFQKQSQGLSISRQPQFYCFSQIKTEHKYAHFSVIRMFTLYIYLYP